MYDELDMILEDAYDDGYYQALYDMGYEFDDAEEDVDIFDDNYFDDAMEGNAANKAAKNGYIRTHGGRNLNRPMPADPKMHRRRGGYNADRDIELKTHGAMRDSYESRPRQWDEMAKTVPVKNKRDLLYDHVDAVRRQGFDSNAESRAIHNADFRAAPKRPSNGGRVRFENTSGTHWL